MAIVVESASTASESSLLAITITKPTGTVQGDLLVALMCVDSAVRTWTQLSGWTKVDLAATGDSETVCWQWKIAGASEGADYTFTCSNANLIAAMVRISGAHPTTPIAASPAGSQSAAVPGHADPPASGSVTSGDYLALAMFASDGDLGASSTQPSGYDEEVDYNGTDGFLGIASKALTGVTSENPGAFAFDVADSWGAFTALIAPGATLHTISPDADTTTTGWTATPLWSKIDEDPASPDGTIVTATAA